MFVAEVFQGVGEHFLDRTDAEDGSSYFITALPEPLFYRFPGKNPRAVHQNELCQLEGQVFSVGNFDGNPSAVGMSQQHSLFNAAKFNKPKDAVGKIVYTPGRLRLAAFPETGHIQSINPPILREVTHHLTKKRDVGAPSVEQYNRFLAVVLEPFSNIVDGNAAEFCLQNVHPFGNKMVLYHFLF